MSKETMSAMTSKMDVEVPEAFAKNGNGLPQRLFELRRTLYCKAKQEPKYQFYTLYALVCREEVIQAAWKMVSRNKGAPGVDGVSIEQIQSNPDVEKKFLDEIRQSLLNKTYEPDEVRRVYIQKENGKMRPLGIPTVKDRVVQTAVVLIIEPIFEADFLECSHGFRPGRSAHDALEQIQEEIRSGKKQAYDADLASYFDTIPHEKLMKCVEKRVTDGSILKLIRMWLKATVVEETKDGKPPRYYRPKQGTPQGGVISPLLANLYLHFFDLMFHKEYGPGKWAQAKLIRYADDFVILAKHVGTRISEFVKLTLEDKMGLKINQEKTAIRNLDGKGNNLEFLGYVYRKEKAKHWSGWYNNMLPSPKALQRIRTKIQEKTNRRNSFKPTEQVIRELNRTLEGWTQYFSKGYCAPAYHAVDSYAQIKLIKHLKRRSQRGYRRPKESSWYQYLETLGYKRISRKLCPV